MQDARCKMQTLCAGFSKTGARYRVPGSGYLAPGIRYRISAGGRTPSTEPGHRKTRTPGLHLASCILYLASCILYFVSCILSQTATREGRL